MAGIIAKSGNNEEGQEKELLPAGSHIAVCYGMIDLGTHKISFKGVDKVRRQVRLVWELTEELRTFKEEKGLEPLSAGKTFTLSMYEKAGLRIFMEGWRGEKYTKEQAEAVDITKMLGVPCMLNITHGENDKGEKYASITSATLMHKSMAKPVQHNPSYFFSLDEYNEEQFQHLPKWLQEKIAESPEYKAIKGIVESSVPATNISTTPAPATSIAKKEPVELLPGTPLWDKVVKAMIDGKKTENDWINDIKKNYVISFTDEDAFLEACGISSNLPF